MIRKFSALAAIAVMGVASIAFAAPPAAQLEASRLSEHVRILASDEYEGRGPATPGEDKAIAYISQQMAAAGLSPGGPNGSWYQDVALERFENVGTPVMSFAAADGSWTRPVKYADEAVIWTNRPVDHVTLENAPLVFVGYGIRAPERGWDDYAGLDVHGKVVVVLINDADFEEPALNTFNGIAMTYYGRWTYKYEEAARQGAAGVIIVHETAPASYGWNTVRNSWTVPQFDIVRPDPNAERVPAQAWIQRDVAVDLFHRAGLDFDALKAKARVKGFRGVPMDATFSADFKVKSEQIVTHNVIGILKGAKRPNETILYTAHWDHLGVGAPDANGDGIFNGAVDNATGSAGVIELGRLFAHGPRPDRSIVFICYTSEEKGLLGSEFYATHPVYPLATTVAGFNMDGLNVVGPTRDVDVTGYGQSDLEDDLVRAATAEHRTVKPAGHPESGSFFRSDHFPLAKRGVPMLYAGSGSDMIEGGEAAGEAANKDYNVHRYHQPDDEWSADWNWEGAIEDLMLNYTIGRDLAFSDRWPQWRTGSEFKPERDKTAGQRH